MKRNFPQAEKGARVIGMKNNEKFIKKTMTAIIFSMAVLFTGCGDKGEGTDTEGNAQVQEVQVQDAGGQTDAEEEAGTQVDDGEAYLDGIQAADYVKLGEYKGLKVVQAVPKVTDELRDSYISYMLCMNPDRGVIEGDTVNIDYVGTLDGVAFDGGTASGQSLEIGSGSFIPGFEEGLVGVHIGETVELPLSFPENYRAEMAGKAVVFTVTVNSIMAAEPQELTDAYVQGLDMGLNTVDEYRQYVYDFLCGEAVADYERQVEDAAVAAALEQCEFTMEPPQAMVDRHIGTLVSNLSSQAASYGITLGQLMEMYGMDEETYQEEFGKQAAEYAKQQIMVKAIADAEGLEVTEEEFQKEAESLVEDSIYGTAEELMAAMDVDGYKEYMLTRKVVELLRENAVVSEE